MDSPPQFPLPDPLPDRAGFDDNAGLDNNARLDDIPEQDDLPAPRGPGEATLEDSLPSTSWIEDIQTSLKFIEMLKNAMLDNSALNEDDLDHLRNPVPLSANVLNDSEFRISLDLFLACQNSP
jgi:hypothetical protein